MTTHNDDKVGLARLKLNATITGEEIDQHYVRIFRHTQCVDWTVVSMRDTNTVLLSLGLYSNARHTVDIRQAAYVTTFSTTLVVVTIMLAAFIDGTNLPILEIAILAALVVRSVWLAVKVRQARRDAANLEQQAIDCVKRVASAYEFVGETQ